MDHHPTNRHPDRRGDSGMTLIELLISISVLGTIVAVIGAAVIVTLRQEPVTRSRLDVAAWEQSLALWLPSDLSSAGPREQDVNAEEGTTPCTTDPVCTFGSNALQLIWDDGTGETRVSYRYGPAADGESFELRRVVCKGGSCSSLIILRDLAVPADDDGNPIPWSAGDVVPDTVINVTVPLAVGSGDSSSCDPNEEDDPDCDTKTKAQRVIVNVNGAPGLDGVDRSSTVSFTAGGSFLSELEPATFSGPEFLDANSGCGGPITLIVDRSGSLSSSDFANVRSGVNSFVDAFDGTPTDLQIITFGTKSSTLGTSDWNRFFDLADPADVALLTDPGGFIDDIVPYSDGRDRGTNWEDALHRAYFSENGQSYEELGSPVAPPPELVIFFTDGKPTLHRGSPLDGYYSTDSSASSIEPSSVPSRFNYDTSYSSGYYGGVFSPLGWYRADYIVDQFRDVRLIGVGVGSAFNDTTQVDRSGWPTSYSYRNIPNEVFLGDLTAGGDPSQHGTSASGEYVVREYDGSWGDVTNANLLVTTQWSQFGSALQQIALAECGGTLTVQTRDSSGQPADASITYQVGDKVKTTTRIAKAGTFDIALNGVPSDTVDLVPQSFEGTGYTPVSWNCRAGGADLVQGPGGDYELISADPADGITITVSAEEAVSCTLSVSP